MTPGGLGPGQTYRIDLMVYAVVFRAAQVVPALQVLGVGPGDIHLDNQGVLSTLSGGGTWEYRTWSTTIQDATNSSISMTLAPPGTGVSVIDRVEIYTRYTVVPEPSVPLLVLLPGLAWCLRRRRH
ncbi:hypothetical protein [Luteolibacter sp. Populi]|uniref:hypothetical protein n=1 Tax=Luteolibacter sp. Populi TaxID=3230487 RepID=UPI0034670D44